MDVLILLAKGTVIGLVIAGTVVGVIVGALPGLSSSMAVALLLPFSLYLEPVPSISMRTSPSASMT